MSNGERLFLLVELRHGLAFLGGRYGEVVSIANPIHIGMDAVRQFQSGEEHTIIMHSCFMRAESADILAVRLCWYLI